MKGIAVRDLFESFARDHTDPKVANRAFSNKVMGLIKEKKISISDVSLKELWEGLVVARGMEESASSTAFPTIAGEIISSVMIAGYDQFPKQGLSLVRVVPSKQKISQIVGWQGIGKLSRSSEVREKEDYPAITPPEEKEIRIKNKKNGLVVAVTKEAIFFDRTGQIMGEASMVGAELARWQDEVIMCALIDLDATAYDLGDMFSGGNSNSYSGAATALGTAAFETMLTYYRKKTDERGRKINTLPGKPVLMHPADLEFTVDKLLNNEKGPIGTAAQSDVNTARGKFQPILNPYFTSTTAWLLGDFKNSARWEEVWPLETYQRIGGLTEDGFKKDVVAEYKGSIYGGCGYDDIHRVIEFAGA